MIDINKAKKEFMNYVKQYGDVNSGRISLKVRHILRVVENSKFIAKDWMMIKLHLQNLLAYFMI